MTKLTNNEEKIITELLDNFYFANMSNMPISTRESFLRDYLAEKKILEMLGYKIDIICIHDYTVRVNLTKGKRILLDQDISLKELRLYHDNDINEYLYCLENDLENILI